MMPSIRPKEISGLIYYELLLLFEEQAHELNNWGYGEFSDAHK